MSRLSEWQIRLIMGTVGVGSIAALLVLEVVTENEAVTFAEVLLEVLEISLAVSAAGGIALLLNRMHVQYEEKMALIRDLDDARREGEVWRAKVQSHLAGLRVEMEKQFEEWGMTTTEQEIGLLLLKGLSHKEIAELRGTSQVTARQQAQSIYQKSRLPGKAAFSAYFLEDLFAPEPTTEVPETVSREAK